MQLTIERENAVCGRGHLDDVLAVDVALDPGGLVMVLVVAQSRLTVRAPPARVDAAARGAK